MLTKAERAGIVERMKRYDGEDDPFYYILFGYSSPCGMPYKERKEGILNRIFNLCDVSNMIELPLDKDGEVIRVGDTVYEEPARGKLTVTCLQYCDGDWVVNTSSSNGLEGYFPQDLAHKGSESIFILAEQVKDIAEDNKNSLNQKIYDNLCYISDQLKELSDEDE
jgi:hypothetical protein